MILLSKKYIICVTAALLLFFISHNISYAFNWKIYKDIEWVYNEDIQIAKNSYEVSTMLSKYKIRQTNPIDTNNNHVAYCSLGSKIESFQVTKNSITGNGLLLIIKEKKEKKIARIKSGSTITQGSSMPYGDILILSFPKHEKDTLSLVLEVIHLNISNWKWSTKSREINWKNKQKKLNTLMTKPILVRR